MTARVPHLRLRRCIRVLMAMCSLTTRTQMFGRAWARHRRRESPFQSSRGEIAGSFRAAKCGPACVRQKCGASAFRDDETCFSFADDFASVAPLMFKTSFSGLIAAAHSPFYADGSLNLAA